MESNLRREATVGLIFVTLVGVSVALGFAAFAGGVAGQEASGDTQAPDLQSVGNFTEGTEGGENYTFVDFTFDQPVEGADSAGNFELVPIDGEPVEDGQNIVDGNATRTITVAFPVSVSQNDTARGIIQPNTLRVAGGTDATTNPLQTAAVSDDGTTDDPDLVNVTLNDSGDALVYAFDEPVSVNSDSGFQAYDANANEAGGNVATDSLATPRLVRVTFDDFDPATAVGASVVEGAVTNTSDSDRTNSPDEVLVSNESAPEFTRCGDGGGGTADMGDGGNGSGPTVAPDLVGIDNVTYRQNPEDTNCQTLVEFDFDEEVTVQGGAGNFQMVPNDSRNFENQVFDGNNEILGATNNTASLTVPFDGRIDPEAVVRGFVDKNTVRAAGEGDETANPKQAVAFNDDGNSANPDLVSVSRAGANELRFAFDEPIGEVESTGSFRFYYANATVRNSLDAAITNNSSVVVAEYAPKFDAGSGAVGGSVANGAVSGTDTEREDGDVNQFDEETVENGTSPGPVGDFENPPTDTDGDGLSEDINGDGQLTQDDAQALYDNLDDSTVQNNADAFDFNGDGSLTQADAQALYNEWSTSN